METEKSCKIGFAITGSFCTHEKKKRDHTGNDKRWHGHHTDFFQKTYRP